MLKPVATLLALIAPLPVLAHPHIFVDSGLKLEVDAGGIVQAAEVTWVYDDFYTLLVFEDMMLDSDLDGELTPAELERLKGFDLNWVEGFEGDLYLSQQDLNLHLGAPEHLSTEVRDGVIITRHRRLVIEETPVKAEGVTARMYDPTYYTAYDLSQGVEVTGPCSASITPPNLDQAYTLVEELLYAMPTQQAEDAFPEVGSAFAAVVSLDCES
ncbi:DUF1007 family protein [Tritonibacter mobilis]|uniref:DUF1007 family protein n=1 Tax=Tritonibacter mobilis TaxID=379347 RepID=UPI001CD966F3|nr:DUF1007 family protein [Tritonibacter mobilis]MCA2009604.1 DUF1007 family protein [Tritonibacter mobilis]